MNSRSASESNAPLHCSPVPDPSCSILFALSKLIPVNIKEHRIHIRSFTVLHSYPRQTSSILHSPCSCRLDCVLLGLLRIHVDPAKLLEHGHAVRFIFFVRDLRNCLTYCPPDYTIVSSGSEMPVFIRDTNVFDMMLFIIVITTDLCSLLYTHFKIHFSLLNLKRFLTVTPWIKEFFVFHSGSSRWDPQICAFSVVAGPFVRAVFYCGGSGRIVIAWR